MRRHRASRTPSTEASTPVARISRPGELALLIPQLLGFTPHESVVALALREPRGRLGLVQRLDLPPPGVQMPGVVVQQIIDRALEDNATRILFAIWTADEDTAEGHPHTELAERLYQAALGSGLSVTDALLVRDGRWWSYRCDRSECCPAAGTPLADDAGGEGLGLAVAEAVLAGRATLASREDLERSIAGVHPLGEDFAVAALTEVAIDQALARLENPQGQRDAILHCWRQALEQARDPRHRLDDDACRALITSLLDGETRDRVVQSGLDEPKQLQQLLEHLCTRSAPPFDAALCTTLAWVAYLAGGGAIVTIALERAIEDDPDNSGARLLLGCLDSGVAPDVLRSAVRGAAGTAGAAAVWPLAENG
ncbi:MAG: hypothetical protein QOK42_1488 [Frankiaceae bacterium]|nr:hypothetical protein [Frankiaceae bacterium]